MVLDYEDEVDGDTPLKARISLEWMGIESAKLGIEDNFLTGLSFRKRGNSIVTLLKTMDQLDGEVIALNVEARLVAMDPAPDGSPEPIVFRLE